MSADSGFPSGQFNCADLLDGYCMSVDRIGLMDQNKFEQKVTETRLAVLNLQKLLLTSRNESRIVCTCTSCMMDSCDPPKIIQAQRRRE